MIGPEQRLKVIDALKSVTIHATYQYYEENQKGTIETRKRVDLVVLSSNPLVEQVDKLDGIELLATYKNGRVVYQAVSPSSRTDCNYGLVPRSIYTAT